MRKEEEKPKVKEACTGDLVVSLPEANSEDLAGAVIGVGASKRHSVGLHKNTFEIKERHK